MIETKTRILIFLFRLFGRLFLLVYNLVAGDTRRGKSGIPIDGSSIKLPAFYDISHWKIVNNWAGILPHPLLMGTKATQSNNYQDPTFIDYFAKMRDIVGCRRLAYHFFEKTVDPVKQADYFINYIEPYITVDDVLCLDFEQGGETASMLWAFLDRVRTRRPNNLVVIYSRKNLADPISMTTSEKSFFKSYPFWTAGYPSNPGSYTTTPPGYIPDQTKWGPVWTWQYTDSGHVDGIDGDTDCNLIEPPFIEWLGGAPPTNEDAVTNPFPGVVRTVGRRFNSDVYVTVIETNQVRFEVVHETPFDNGLFRTSDACRSRGAALGWNGDEWDKAYPLPAFPKNVAWSNGTEYVTRKSAEPALTVTAAGAAEIAHARTGREYNTSCGRRYLLENGVIKDYLYGTEPQYTERHPRGLVGLSQNNSKVIMVTVDGRSSVSAGVTLLEGAQILKEFGAYVAYDRGGGGDAVDVMNGIVQNVPCDTGTDGQPGVERAIPQSILVYAEEDQPMTSRFEATALGDGTRIRVTHDTSGKYVNSYPRGTTFQGDDGVNDSNTVNGLFTAPNDLSNSNGVYQKKGDKWLAVKTVNGSPPVNMDTGQPMTNQTWVAITHMGGAICSIVDHGGTIPPPTETPPQEVTVTDENGVKWKANTFTKVT